MDTPSQPGCTRCGQIYMPWVTTCADCGAPVDNGYAAELADQPAPARITPDRWIDIQVSSDQPVEVALLRHFLIDNGFEIEESRRFISVPAAEADRLAAAIEVWAFSSDMPDDPRHLDTLGATLRDLGYRVLHAVQTHIRLEHGLAEARRVPTRADVSRAHLRAEAARRSAPPPSVDLR